MVSICLIFMNFMIELRKNNFFFLGKAEQCIEKIIFCSISWENDVKFILRIKERANKSENIQTEVLSTKSLPEHLAKISTFFIW